MNGTCLKLLVYTSITALIIQAGCQVGGSGSFVQGRTPDENNALYSGEPTTGDWVVMNLLDEPENLNPYISSSASASNIYSGYLYESFLQTRREPPWDDEPLLIEDMPDISADHLVYTWRLRRDVHWHDGQPMTMHDAVMTLKAIMNPYVDDLPTKPYYNELDSLQLIDDYTLRMFCSKPYFLHLEFLGSFSVMPKHVFDPDGTLDDLTYFQVKNGAAYGQVADFLESGANVSWENCFPEVVVFKLKNSIFTLSDENVKWKDIEKAIQDLSSLSSEQRLGQVRTFLENHPHGGRALQWLKNTGSSLEKAIGILPLAAQIEMLSGADAFPMRDSLAAICRDIHSRIETFGNSFNSHPQNSAPTVASGPFVFDHWMTGQEVVIRRNENYWQGEGHAYLDRIIWRVLTDYTASLVALKNGEIDFMENLQTIQYLTMFNRRKYLDKFIKTTNIVPSYNYLGWRNGHPIFKDKWVRRAMTHMVRRKDIRDKLQFGFAEIVTGNFYRYGRDYDSTIVPWEYNPELAVELLEKAGWKDVDNDGILEKDTLEFRFELLIPSGTPLADQVASILREDLFMIGVEMGIRRLEWSVFINNYIRNHNFDACFLGWVFGMKGDPKQVWHSESATGRGSNHVEFMNPEADSLIDAARVEFDDEKRIKMYHRFQQILHEEQPYTFMFSTMRKPAYEARIKGVKWYPFRPGYKFDEWFVPAEEQKYR